MYWIGLNTIIFIYYNNNHSFEIRKKKIVLVYDVIIEYCKPSMLSSHIYAGFEI